MPRNPLHPWVGESVALDWANPVAASFTDDGDAMRYHDGDTTTLTSGQAFIAGFFASESLLSGDAAVFSFAVECSGSGSLRLSGGTDAAFTLDDPSEATQSLGTFTVSGAQTVASGALTRDVDDYLAQAVETIVYVECLSGSVTIDQVRLRIWPPGGAVGYWSPTVRPAESYLDAAPDQWTVGGGSVIGSVDYQAEPVGPFDDQAAQLAGDWAANTDDVRTPDPRVDWTAGSSITASIFSNVNSGLQTLLPLYFQAGHTLDHSMGVAQQPDPVAYALSAAPGTAPGTYGLDVVWPPDVVPGDVGGVQFLGTPTVAWGPAEVRIDAASELHRATASYIITAITDGATEVGASITAPAGGGTAITTIPTDPGNLAAVSLPAARTILLSMSASNAEVAATYLSEDSNGTSLSEASAAVTVFFSESTITVPAYRYWSPTATPEHPLRLMQRGDALGMGSGRILGAGTRQGSLKVFGSL